MKSKKVLLIGLFILIIVIPLVLYWYLSDVELKNVLDRQKNINGLNPPISLNQDKEKLLESLVRNRKVLVESDQQVKNALIKQPNPLFTNKDYLISYDKEDDMFQVEIKTIKIDTVRSEAIEWFKAKGFSGAAVCTLPIQFSIDAQYAENLRNTGIIFNPLPPGC
jgi:hypothetical protein